MVNAVSPTCTSAVTLDRTQYQP